MFRVDVLDTNDDQVGDGPLTNVEAVTIRRSLDRAGGADIILPATDPKTTVVQAGRKYRIYNQRYGALGTFLHANQNVQAGSDQPKLRLKTYDRLIELARKNVYFRRAFNNVAVDSVVGTLTGLASGWSTGTVETGIGNTSVTYEGESVFEAVDVLRDRWGRHFRLNGDRVLDFGSFGDDSGIRLIRPDSIPREMEGNDDIAFVTGLEILEEAETVINRVIPVGAGAGTTQLTLENVTSSDASYPVQTGTNADGSSFYYIEDTTSQGTYGVIERPFERSDIRPLTNSTANLQNAANALYRAALAFLLKYKDPRTTYRVNVTKLDPSRLKPGDTVRLFFRGIVQRDGLPYKWVDVDEDLWVLDIEERYDSRGQQAIRLTVATTADRRTQDDDILARLVRDTKVFKTHVQPNLTHSPVGPYVKRMDSSNTATFNVRLKDEVLAVNRVILRFITAPLRASVTGAASGGGSTSGASSETSSGASTLSTTDAGGSSSPTSDAGGSSSPTSNSGGSSSPTSNSGGGSTETSDSAASHNHDSITINRILVAALNSNHKPLYFHQNDEDIVFPTNDGGPSSHTVTGSSENSHSHDVTIPSHTHVVSIPSHTHVVSIPSHTHVVTIPSHSHGMAHTHGISHTHTTPDHTHGMTYGLFQDTTYPQTISVTINGVDRTSALGGTWAPSNAAVDEELDITDYINRGQDNTVVFSCTAGQGELTFLGDCLLTIQAIVVT